MTEELNLRLVDVLGAAADALVAELDADACSISRVIGDVLILVTERAHDGPTLLRGRATSSPTIRRRPKSSRRAYPRALTLDDDDLDAAEAGVLRELRLRIAADAPARDRR